MAGSVALQALLSPGDSRAKHRYPLQTGSRNKVIVRLVTHPKMITDDYPLHRKGVYVRVRKVVWRGHSCPRKSQHGTAGSRQANALFRGALEKSEVGTRILQY